jgi:hypothetical protein
VQTCRVKGILPSAGGNKSGKDKGNTSQNNWILENTPLWEPQVSQF